MMIDLENKVAKILCGKPYSLSCKECYSTNNGYICKDSKQCRISEKTEDQLKYVVSSIYENFFLSACPGSGKTEVVGMKAAYEINKWQNYNTGIAILSFTNQATDVIKNRVNSFCEFNSLYPHFIGTLSSFIHEYITQPFGYAFVNYTSINNDASFTIIDKKDRNKNSWLNNYKNKINFRSSTNKQIEIYANNLVYDILEKDFIVQYSKYIDVYFLKHYYSKNFQKWLSEIRDKTGKQQLFGLKYCYEQLQKCKAKFNKDGYANYEDMNSIAYNILGNLKICTNIARKFPLIIVDECQDLSYIELLILYKLKEQGSNIHFIGDINQSVYEFKRVNPEKILRFTKEFIKMHLVDNFRSCNNIVKFSEKLIKNEFDIIGKEKCLYNDKSLIYIEYNTPKDSIISYKKILDEFQIEYNKACVLVKQNSLKNQICDLNDKYDRHLLIYAIQLWNMDDAYKKQKALQNIGKQIAVWFKSSYSVFNYYCPHTIKSVFYWRLFLRDIMNDISSNTVLNNFSMKNNIWYKNARRIIPSIIIDRYDKIKKFDIEVRNFDSIFSGNWYNAKDSAQLVKLVEINKKLDIEINTIHGSKGCTYDTTLVISSKDSKSESGHWKDHWLEGTAADKRVGYVASTRAKYLLAWAIPTLTPEDRKILEDLGFINYKECIVDDTIS